MARRGKTDQLKLILFLAAIVAMLAVVASSGVRSSAQNENANQPAAPAAQANTGAQRGIGIANCRLNRGGDGRGLDQRADRSACAILAGYIVRHDLTKQVVESLTQALGL